MKEVMDFYEKIFPGEEAMKDPANRKVWNPIFNFNYVRMPEIMRR